MSSANSRRKKKKQSQSWKRRGGGGAGVGGQGENEGVGKRGREEENLPESRSARHTAFQGTCMQGTHRNISLHFINYKIKTTNFRLSQIVYSQRIWKKRSKRNARDRGMEGREKKKSIVDGVPSVCLSLLF